MVEILTVEEKAECETCGDRLHITLKTIVAADKPGSSRPITANCTTCGAWVLRQCDDLSVKSFFRLPPVPATSPAVLYAAPPAMAGNPTTTVPEPFSGTILQCLRKAKADWSKIKVNRPSIEVSPSVSIDTDLIEEFIQDPALFAIHWYNPVRRMRREPADLVGVTNGQNFPDVTDALHEAAKHQNRITTIYKAGERNVALLHQDVVRVLIGYLAK